MRIATAFGALQVICLTAAIAHSAPSQQTFGSVEKARDAALKGVDRDRAISELATYGSAGVAPLLQIALASPNDHYMTGSPIYRALAALLRDVPQNRNPETLKAALSAYRSATPEHNFDMVQVLFWFHDLPGAQEELAKAAVAGANPMVRSFVLADMGSWGHAYLGQLKEALKDENILIRATAARALAQLKQDSGYPIAAKILTGTDPNVKLGSPEGRAIREAVYTMEFLGTKKDLPAIARFSQNQDHKFAAQRAIWRITLREMPERTQKIKYIKDEWEKTGNDYLQKELAGLLSYKEQAEFYHSALKKGTLEQRIQFEAINYLYTHGWIAREDRFKNGNSIILRTVPKRDY